MEMIRHLHFLRPAWLLALPVMWGWALWLARRHDRDGNWGSLIDPELLAGLRLSSDSGKPARSPWPWLMLAWSLAVLALAGPAWQRDTTAAWRVPDAWVLLLDLSPSMAATDLAPDRASRARFAIDPQLLQDIATTSGGEFFRAADRASLSQSFHSILDRLVHNAHRIDLTGESMRKDPGGKETAQ